MKKLRYFIETVPKGQPTRMGQLAGRHHAVWIDDTTSFGLGEFDVFEMDLIANEDTIHMFDSAVDSTPAHQQVTNSHKPLDKNKVKKALTNHGVTASDTIEQAALKIARNTKHRHLEP